MGAGHELHYKPCIWQRQIIDQAEQGQEVNLQGKELTLERVRTLVARLGECGWVSCPDAHCCPLLCCGATSSCQSRLNHK